MSGDLSDTEWLALGWATITGWAKLPAGGGEGPFHHWAPGEGRGFGAERHAAWYWTACRLKSKLPRRGPMAPGSPGVAPLLPSVPHRSCCKRCLAVVDRRELVAELRRLADGGTRLAAGARLRLAELGEPVCGTPTRIRGAGCRSCGASPEELCR